MMKLFPRTIRTCLALLAVFSLLTASFESLHHHHGPQSSADHCPECLALAASGTAIVATVDFCLELSETFEIVVTPVAECTFVLLPSVDHCRGPPALV